MRTDTTIRAHRSQWNSFVSVFCSTCTIPTSEIGTVKLKGRVVEFQRGEKEKREAGPAFIFYADTEIGAEWLADLYFI